MAMGIVASFMDRRIGAELNERGVLVWYDPARAWQPWIQTAHGGSSPGKETTAAQVTIGGRDAHLVVSVGSHYEVLQACEPLVSGPDPPRLLVYVPGEPYLEMLSPLRELECLGGVKEPYQRDLTQVARQAFQSAGLSESKIDELVNRDGLDFAYLDSISVGDGGASPLAPVFGSSRELDVIPSFLAEPERRAEAAAKGLLPEVARLASQGLGLALKAEADAEAMAQELARALLAAEFRRDLETDAPKEISLLPQPATDEQHERVTKVCGRLRYEFAVEYEELATRVQEELGLQHADIDPLKLGRIDTFPFEEERLLEACDALLLRGEARKALEIVDARATSFWTSVARHPDRHAAWRACGELATLALKAREAKTALKAAPDKPQEWLERYAGENGLHSLDRSFRRTRYRLKRMEDEAALDRAASYVFRLYEGVLESMTLGFTASLRRNGFAVPGTLSQVSVYAQRVAPISDTVGYFLVDSLRFEMGAELLEHLEGIGATATRLEPAVASIPTITPIGMASVLPGAERSFTVTEDSGGVYGTVEGRSLRRASDRMDHAKSVVPSLVEMTLDQVIAELSKRKLKSAIEGAKVVIVRSLEIDSAGESLQSGLAQRVMGTVLEDVRKGVLRLAAAGIRRFVITADHGHLFATRRGEDMRIDPPDGGKKVGLHRRCWIGRGGSTPSACIRVAGRDLGYDTDLDFVFPEGLGVFKGGGDLSYHHGGLSLQELIIPVLSFELVRAEPKGRRKPESVILEGVPDKITNRIFSFYVSPSQADVEPRSLRITAVAANDQRTVGQVIYGDIGFEEASKLLRLENLDPVSVAMQLDDDDVEELRLIVADANTGLLLKDTEPIPVDLVR